MTPQIKTIGIRHTDPHVPAAMHASIDEVIRAFRLTPDQFNKCRERTEAIITKNHGQIAESIADMIEQIPDRSELGFSLYALGADFTVVAFRAHMKKVTEEALMKGIEIGSGMRTEQVTFEEPDGEPEQSIPGAPRPAPEPDMSIQGMYE